MPNLASHRKSRSRSGERVSSPAVGVTTAAIASVTLLSTQSADAAPAEPKPSVEEVQKKVDALYRQAGGETQTFTKATKAKETTAKQKRTVDRVIDGVAKSIDGVAKSADKLNEARRTLGSSVAAQYREGAGTPTAAVLFADTPQARVAPEETTDRLTDRQQSTVTAYPARPTEPPKVPGRAATRPESPDESPEYLRTSKESIQKKLAEARSLLARLTAEEQARLAALERKREEETRRAAEAKAKAEARDKAEAEAEAERRREAGQAQTHARPRSHARPSSADTDAGANTDADAGMGTTANAGTAVGTGTEAGTGGDTAGTYAAKAAKVLAFADAQIGKPYVWGASGPSSYDSSGLTQAAWRAAGVELPRTTGEQVNAGTRVATDDLLPGDLVFFYDDASHAGIYIGDGMMVHAPKPGANVREESIYYMPIYGSIRPA
ncbi:C40 family peptidase [Streptomyces sp. NPDC050509]|uniref:C40 family peptidase n=1 Tax=Streptomyces sp. NPDC050509 TaxID=3365620 RepID=UPI0037A466A2